MVRLPAVICVLALTLIGCVALAIAESHRREPEVLLGDTVIARGRASAPSGTALAFRYGAVKSGAARAIVVFVSRGSHRADLHVGLYANDNGRPARLLASGSRRWQGLGKWYSVSLAASPSIVKGHAYWIAVRGFGGTLRFRGHRSTAGGCLKSSQRAAGALPSVWRGGGRPSLCSLSAYVTGVSNARAASQGATHPRAGGSASAGGDPPPANTAPPSITGQAAVGKTLTGTNGSWSGNPATYSVQWEDCDASGGACSPIGGATGGSYTLADGDVGHTVRVSVTASGQGGNTTARSGPTSVVTAQPIHTETWAYDDCGIGASAALVRKWVTYAESNCGGAGEATALSDCHSGGVVYCDVIQYLDTNVLYDASCCMSDQWPSWNQVAQENWYLHEAPPNESTRITTSAYGGGDLDNVANPAVVAFYKNYVRGSFPNADGLMLDDTDPSIAQLLYGTSDQGAAATNEITSNAQLQAAHVALQDALSKSDGSPYLEVTNGLSDGGNPNEPATGVGPTGNQITAAAPGIIAEGSPEDDGSIDEWYPGLLDDMAYVDNQTSGFIVLLSDGAAGASDQQQARLVQEATVLLGYEPGRVVDWADLETGDSDLAVWPEEGIYPTQPVQTMSGPGGAGCLAGTGVYCSTGGHNDLEVAAGVYRREFADCYNQDSFFGTCAAIVNTTGSAVTVSSSWLTQSYQNSITLSGGDVQSGGSIDLAGSPFTAGTTRVPADGALILSGT